MAVSTSIVFPEGTVMRVESPFDTLMQVIESPDDSLLPWCPVPPETDESITDDSANRTVDDIK
ncbi:MAG: hypothetical protein QGH39_08730 [Candidatus Thermoplasmatota archaeon]|nr:hypothetical protein [Candidatus Thermoplasmatota archaeon]